MTAERCPLCGGTEASVFQETVWNSPAKRVMRCSDCEAYFLYPFPTEAEQRAFDAQYDQYIAARAALVAPHTTETFDVNVDESIAERFRDIQHRFPPGVSVLEIGAEKGGFLDRIRPTGGTLAAVDSCPDYLSILREKGYVAYPYIWDVPADARFDRVCAFSLLEHIPEPVPFLQRVRECLTAEGYAVIEIPSAKEPLLSLYDVDAFKAFYFQAMHPYVYSEKACKLVFSQAGLRVAHVQYKQRYGLSNHLQWIKAGVPGGNPHFARLFVGAAEQAYIRALEASGHTDTLYVIAQPASS